MGPTLENYEGYAAYVNTFTYLICQVGLGNISSLDGFKSSKVDIVPADFAGNLLVVLGGREQGNKVEFVNLSTTTRNYITLREFVELCGEAWREYGEKPRKVSIVETKLGQKLKHKTERLPSEVKKRLGGMLDVVSWKIDGQRQSLEQ